MDISYNLGTNEWHILVDFDVFMCYLTNNQLHESGNLRIIIRISNFPAFVKKQTAFWPWGMHAKSLLCKVFAKSLKTTAQKFIIYDKKLFFDKICLFKLARDRKYCISTNNFSINFIKEEFLVVHFKISRCIFQWFCKHFAVWRFCMHFSRT